MDTKDYSTEHRKGQHLFSEERHEIEVRLKDGWSIYRIAKHLGRPYNTIKNEVARGSVKLYRGKVVRYKADVGEKTYTENRSRSRRQYKRLEVSPFLQYVETQFAKGWSLDACVGEALESGRFQREQTVCTKTLYNYVDQGLIGPILCLGRSLVIEPQNSYLSRNWTVFTPWKFFPPRSLLELVQLAIAFYATKVLELELLQIHKNRYSSRPKYGQKL